MSQMKMVVGLGNPGEEYVNTRHNIGFKVIGSLAKALAIDVRKRKFGARVGLGEVGGKNLILLKPWQFMNRSGEAVAKAVGFYKLPLSELLVVTDDMALEPGRIRIRAKGSAGGHKGLADVIDKLGTNQFGRLRVGIGSPSARLWREQEAIDYVLGGPTRDERPLLDEAIERAKEVVLCWLELGIEAAMNKFNRTDISS
jgi:PTH1 family peptidyl-tRNA hydrolase